MHPCAPQGCFSDPRAGQDIHGLGPEPASIDQLAICDEHRGGGHGTAGEDFFGGRGRILLDDQAQLMQLVVKAVECPSYNRQREQRPVEQLVAQRSLDVGWHGEDLARLLQARLVLAGRRLLLLPVHPPDSLRQGRGDFVLVEKRPQRRLLLVALRIQVEQLGHGGCHLAQECGKRDKSNQHDEAGEEALAKRHRGQVLRGRGELC
mmetsp:Transcript_62634/g.180136  ORF Transcript_62634/g.180136 Transcript_62634/m.180136 type:complete len:206 (+) Transcript_62634:583-1200(+)